MRIEINIGYDEPQSLHTDFEHYEYYESIDDAIRALQNLRKVEIFSRPEKCHKCVYEYECTNYRFNKPCTNFKRDPPDGGYYG